LKLSQKWVADWTAVMAHPGIFFNERVESGRQSNGLIFAMGVIALEEGSRLMLIDTRYYFISLGIAVLIITPILLHIVAAIQTLLLRLFVENRRGIGATVQVIGYSIAPCVFAGFTIPALRIVCAAYGSLLLVIGLREVHNISLVRAILVASVPAIIIFGYVFRGVSSMGHLLS
tara:strand:+ start:5716 stop:6237 length:522 start_codon:yes stop_codon:yes gene_type:complete